MSQERRNFRLTKDVLPSRYELHFQLDFDDWSSVGTERVAVRLARPSREIVLHSLDLDIQSASVDDQAAERPQYDTAAETVTLRFTREIPAGEHTLAIGWRGEWLRARIPQTLSYLGIDHDGSGWEVEGMIVTDVHVLSPYLRHCPLPVYAWAEFKARFTLELVHPSGNAAIANMPIERQEQLGEHRTVTRFRETPKISSYLVAFTVGPYEFTPTATTPSGIPVRVCLPPGLAEQGIYARDAHVRSVEWLQGYTAIPYPYYKVDAIGIPDFEAGAMENPGAITYRTRLLAADSRNASITTMKGVFSTAAHELTHMWWGDLVTMRWWTDLWLNESFASFVGEKATATLNPEWRYWRDFVADNASAFNLDSLASTHPISVEAKSVVLIGRSMSLVSAAFASATNLTSSCSFCDAQRMAACRSGLLAMSG